MLSRKATSWLSIAFVATASLGCQLIGGVSDELSLAPVEGLPARVPLLWEAGAPSDSEMLGYVLPEWLHYASDNDSRTSLYGPDAVVVGFPRDAARPRQVKGPWGLSMERMRRNRIPRSIWGAQGWAAGAMMKVTGQPDPAGGTEAVGYLSIGGQLSDSFSPLVSTGSMVATTWAAGSEVGSAQPPPFAYFVFANSAIPVGEKIAKRYEVVRPPNEASANIMFSTKAVSGFPAISGNTAIGGYGPQIEDGMYPSSYIPTNGAPITRNADILSIDTADFAPSGYFMFKMRYAPHYATDEQTDHHDLLAITADAVFVRMEVGGTLKLFVGSLPPGQQELSLSGLSWEREQQLEVEVAYLPSKRTLSIKGASSGDNAVVSNSAMPKLGNDPSAWILGDSSGSQESADLRYLEVR